MQTLSPTPQIYSELRKRECPRQDSNLPMRTARVGRAIGRRLHIIAKRLAESTECLVFDHAGRQFESSISEPTRATASRQQQGDRR
jgi:hypothetical protein